MSRLSLLCAFSALLLVASPSFAGKKKAFDKRVAEMFERGKKGPTGQEILKGLATAKKVRAYRTHPNNLMGAERKTFKGPRVGDYKITSKAVSVSAAQHKSLVAILQNPKTYDFDRAKACKFNPGVAIQMEVGKHTLSLLFCFGCKEMRMYVNNEITGSEDFDNANKELVAMVKALFPKDKAIQGLK